jgi:hypothetical protein
MMKWFWKKSTLIVLFHDEFYKPNSFSTKKIPFHLRTMKIRHILESSPWHILRKSKFFRWQTLQHKCLK